MVHVGAQSVCFVTKILCLLFIIFTFLALGVESPRGGAIHWGTSWERCSIALPSVAGREASIDLFPRLGSLAGRPFGLHVFSFVSFSTVQFDFVSRRVRSWPCPAWAALRLTSAPTVGGGTRTTRKRFTIRFRGIPSHTRRSLSTQKTKINKHATSPKTNLYESKTAYVRVVMPSTNHPRKLIFNPNVKFVWGPNRHHKLSNHPRTRQHDAIPHSSKTNATK